MCLVTVGTVAFDSIETPYGKVEKVIGGAATYICWAASYFCSELQLVSVIGDDWPKGELAALRERGVDLEGLQIKTGEDSFFWSGKYHDNMNERDTLVTDLNALADFDPVLPESYRNSPYLMLGNLTPDIQQAVIKQMKSKPRVIAMDTMNFWMDIAWDSLIETIKQVDVLTINDEEARQLSGEYSLMKAARKIFTMGPKYLVIKKGEHGALLFHEHDVFFAPALPLLEVKDPTGAGDTFAGGFMGYLAKTDDISFENLKRALIYGSAMASFCVEEFSLNRLKDISVSELQTRVQQFKQLVHYEI